MNLPAFTQHGSGETAVLLLHGIGGGQAIWNDEVSGTAAALATAGYAAVSIDLPGYGASAAMGPPDMEAFVAGVVELSGLLARDEALDVRSDPVLLVDDPDQKSRVLLLDVCEHLAERRAGRCDRGHARGVAAEMRWQQHAGHAIDATVTA